MNGFPALFSIIGAVVPAVIAGHVLFHSQRQYARWAKSAVVISAFAGIGWGVFGFALADKLYSTRYSYFDFLFLKHICGGLAIGFLLSIYMARPYAETESGNLTDDPQQIAPAHPAVVRSARESSRLEIFLPRSRSVFVFVPVVACYDFAITVLFAVMVGVLHFPPRPPSFWESHGDPVAHLIEALAFAPLFESCLLVALIELLRWLRTPTVFQVLLAAVALAAPHSYSWGWEPYAFIVAPSFAIQAASYIYWRAASRMQGFAVVASIHALHNLIPVLGMIAYATRKT